MKKKLSIIIIIILICAFLIVGLLVTVSILNSRSTAIHQAEQRLSLMCDKYASEFDATFTNCEQIVDDLAAVIEQDYSVGEYGNDRAAFERKLEQTGELVRKTMTHTDHPMGLYITFSPEAFGGKDEIWFSRDENGNVQYMDSIALSNDSWLEEDDPDASYYFDTLKAGKPVWSEAGYDPGMGGEVVSYMRPLYDSEGQTIGVIGTDILVENMLGELTKINEQTGGESTLIDVNAGIITGVDNEKYRNSPKYIYAEAPVGDRWIIAIMQPIREAIGSVLATAAAVILLGILILIAAVIAVVRLSQTKVRPIIDEAELKDAMMASQARQAKMGEMVGNIAHQWKQPLNGMKMALANMSEDYEQGILEKEDFERYVSRMGTMVGHLAETADDFIDFLKPDKKKEVFSVNEEISRMLDLMDERIRLAGIDVVISGPEIKLEGYRNEFGQCMFNLIDNARDALLEAASDGQTEGPLRIDITTSTEGAGDGEYSIIRVHNNGHPISPEDAPKIFDLYFSTKEDREGTGIGLYLAREIIRNHYQGELYFENKNNGVDFIIKVPTSTGAEEVEEQ